jgi:hypothetical protein
LVLVAQVSFKIQVVLVYMEIPVQLLYLALYRLLEVVEVLVEVQAVELVALEVAVAMLGLTLLVVLEILHQLLQPKVLLVELAQA